jgi:hypothetical protein
MKQDKQFRPRLTEEEYNLVLKSRMDGDEVSPSDFDAGLIDNKTKYTESGDSSTIEGVISSSDTDRVKILDEFLVLCKVDLSAWEVDHYLLNAWDVTMSGAKSSTKQDAAYTNYQIKVWLKRKTQLVLSFELLINRLQERQQQVPVIEATRKRTGYLYEICLFDNHFGKLCWKPETGDDYDLKIAKTAFSAAIDQFFIHAKSFQPEQILFPVGNDFLHIDNDQKTTTKGTVQDVDGRLPKIYDVAFDAIVESVEKLLTIAPVHLIWVSSNHDLWVSYFLCKAIKAYYTNNKNVTIDVRPKSRKIYEWGKVLIGFEHGEIKPDRLPLLMADEWPNEWARTRWHEWHTGHLHKKQEMVFTSVDTFGSVIYRRIPSLTKTDVWHYQNGFVNKTRAAETYVWDKEYGLVSNFPIYID